MRPLLPSPTRPRARALWPLITLWCALALAGCERPRAATEATPPARPASTSPPVIQATSAALPEHPKRLVSLAPNLTEILFALGAGEQVVGVTRFCDWPAEALKKPRVGGLIDPDLEALIAQRPELVLGMVGGADQKLPARLDRAGLPYAFVRLRTIDETLQGIEAVGRLIGREAAARALVTTMRAELDAQEIIARARPGRPRVLVVLGHKPLVAAGPSSFVGELVVRAGGVHVIEAGGPAYPRLDLERVIALRPTHILDLTMTPGQDPRAFWEAHRAQLPALKAGGLRVLHDGALLRPGPRLPRALALVVAALGPADEAP